MINTNYQAYQISPQSTNSTQNLQSTTSANFALDKSQAVSQILGYGVDSEGYFTSDFNEVAGLPKDYKINAKEFENLLSLTQSNSINNLTFTDIDLTKSLGNAYKLFSQFNPSNVIDKGDFSNIPQYFEYNVRNFEITKIYQSKEEFESVDKQGVYDFTAQAKLDFSGIDFGDEISKGEALLGFFKAIQGKNASGGWAVLEGETTIIGKKAGLDRSMSLEEVEDLNNFLQNHKITHTNNREITRQVLLMPMQMTNIEEFKEKWLELEALNEEALAQQGQNTDEASQTQILDTKKAEENTEDSEEKDKKSFTPIQAESSRETYKDLSSVKNLELAKMEQMADMLAILFNQKAGETSALKAYLAHKQEK